MKRELANQYGYAFTMLRKVVEETTEDTWWYTDDVKEAAWHIAYHAVLLHEYLLQPHPGSREKVGEAIRGFTPPWRNAVASPREVRTRRHLLESRCHRVYRLRRGGDTRLPGASRTGKTVLASLVQAESVRVPPEQSATHPASYGTAHRAERWHLRGMAGIRMTL